MKRTPVVLAFCALALFGPTVASAGCDFNFRVQNDAAHAIDVQVSSVRVRSGTSVGWGPWRRADRGRWSPSGNSLTLQPGRQFTDVYETAMGCRASRQFQATYVCRGGPRAGSSYRETIGHGGARRNSHVSYRSVNLRLGSSC